MKKLDICLSPTLLPLYELSGKTVVVADIFRATSSMVTAFAHGIARIKPVADVDECRALRDADYLTAGERNGIKVTTFDCGNSPYDYQRESIRGKSLAMTTTNGTQAIELAKHASELLIGAFLNLEALAEYLAIQDNDVLVVCAGWKGHVNLEDTLFAGALLDLLAGHFSAESDAALIAQVSYQTAQNNLLDFLSKSSHVGRLQNLGRQEDIAFCLQHNQYRVVPYLQEDHLVVAQ